MKTLTEKELTMCVGGDAGNSGKESVDGCFQHKEGKILTGDQVEQGGVIVGTQLLGDTISTERFPWSPVEC